MRVLIAPDSFKGSLTSGEVANAVSEGLKKADPDTETVLLPLADGGEGTAQCLYENLGGEKIFVRTKNIFFEDIDGYYILLPDGTAVVECAVASGLTTVEKSRLNPMKASTFGTGLIFKAAVENGAKRLIAAMGGSASNDGGTGALNALGIDFLNENGNALLPTGENLGMIKSVKVNGDFKKYSSVPVTLACDVENPFYGENGAARVFAGQKGADGEQIDLLDRGLENLERVIFEYNGVSLQKIKGAGAAGGLCGGLFAFLNAEIKSGFDVLDERLGISETIKNCDLVITGEGRTDYQTAFGKLPVRISALAGRAGKPCVLISGDIEEGLDTAKLGFCECRKLKKGSVTLENAIENAYNLLVDEASKIRVMK
jgi:glycerate kinase